MAFPPALVKDADLWDIILMTLATLTAILHGIVLPSAMLVFGLLTNAFVNQFSSATLANYELEFDPAFYIENNRLGAVDFRVILPGFINFTNITGGVVNCSDSYELLPFNQTFDDILRLGVTQLARCLDNPSFLVLVTRYTWVFVGLGVLSGILGFTHTSLFRWSGVRQVTRLRYRLFASLLRQEIGWYDATPPGEIVSRISEDVGKVEEGLGEKMGLLIQWLTTLVAGFIVSFITEWRLTLLMTFAGILIAGSTALLSVVTSFTTSHSLSLSAAASAIAEEALSAVATVKAFCAESGEVKRYSNALRRERLYGICVGVIRGVCLGVVQFLVFSCYASSFWLGAYLVQEELIQAGEFVTVFFAVLLVGVSVGQALPHLQRLVAAETADKRLQIMIARVPLIIDEDEALWATETEDSSWPEEEFQPAVQFVNVSFSYPTRSDDQVLKDVNLTFDPGQTVAIVGSTGSGKSTIGHMITRLYDATNGQVRVGGKDIQSVPLAKLRAKVGVVSQDPALFQTSISENIGLGGVAKLGLVTKARLDWAAQLANASEFISQLPQGYSTLVGSRGGQLSGGQKQRIAIARALVRNPKILLLDEATSALDTESERSVQEALDKARHRRTTIIIAHRLSTVRNADKIVVMEKGGVAEEGTHEELLAKKGTYFDLVNAQLMEEEEEGGSGGGNEEGEMDGNVPSPTSPTSPLSLQGKVMEEEVMEAAVSTSARYVLGLSVSEWPLLVAGVIAAGVQGAVFPSFSIFFGRALEAFTFPFFMVLGLTHKWAGLFVALGCISAVATVIKTISFSLAGQQLTYRLRRQVFRQILKHRLSWFDKPSSSGAAGTLSSNPPLVQGVMLSLSSLTEVGVGLLAAVVIAAVSSWILAVVIVGFIPLLLLAGLVQVWVLGDSRASQSPSTQILQESVVNIKTLQLFGLENSFLNRYQSAISQTIPKKLRQAVGLGLAYGFSNCILFFAYATTFRFAAYLLTLHVDHALYANFDEVFTVFLAIILGSLAAGQATTALPLATQATAAASKLKSVTETAEGDEDDEKGKELDVMKIRGSVRIENVSFAFPSRPAVRVLSRMSVAVATGESLALVGPSGGGKSTVFYLLERLYNPSAGVLKIDDVDISTMKLKDWRRQIGWVQQDVVLLNRSVAENITLGFDDDEIEHDKIVAAATAANIHDFIATLPKGYSTLVGSRGGQLSGGQKQRIAIARALVRNPKILLLDEATSALDTESERSVQEALDKARHRRTTIIIAHRLSTVAKADAIAVLSAGKIVETGTHEQLLRQQGLYWRLVSHTLTEHHK